VISHEHLEFLSLDIKQLNSPTMKTGVVYRPHDSIVQWYTDFESCMEQLSTQNENMVIMGDLNMDQLKEDRMRSLMNTLN